MLDAAAEVFARRGYREASVAEIARSAGYSTGALYVHFSGKHDLFLALFDTALTEWGMGYLDATSQAGTVAEMIEAAGRRWGQLQDENPAQTMLFMEFWSVAVRDSDLRGEFAQRHAAMRATIGSLVAGLRSATGVELGVSEEKVGPILTALADGFALQRLIDPEAVPDSLFIEAVQAVLGIRE